MVDTTSKELNNNNIPEVRLDIPSKGDLADNLAKIISNGIIMAKAKEENFKPELIAGYKNIKEEISESKLTVENGINAVVDALKPLSKIHDEVLKDVKYREELTNEIKKLKEQNKSSSLIESQSNGKFTKAIAVAFRGLSFAGKITKDVLEIFNKTVEKSIGRFKELNESGVRLANGYEDTIWKLSNASGMFIDDFSKVLQENSKYVNSLTLGNNLGGEYTIAKAMDKMIGTFGTTEKQAKNILNYFNESMYGIVDFTKLTDEEYVFQIEKLTKNLQELSKATGLSVEQIIQKNKLDESDLLHRQLRTKDYDTYQTLSASGISKKTIEYIMLGTPSAEVYTQMALNQVEGKAIETARKAYEKGGYEGLKTAFIEFKENIPEISRGQMQTIAMAGKDSPLIQMMGYFLAQYMTEYGAKGKVLGPNERSDNDSLNKTLDYQKSLNKMYNESLAAVTPKIDKVGKAVDTMKIAVDGVTLSIQKTFGSDGKGRDVSSLLAPVLTSAVAIGTNIYTFKNIMKKIAGSESAVSDASSIGEVGKVGKLGKLGTVGKLIKRGLVLDTIIGSVSDISNIATKGGDEVLREKREGLKGWDYISPYRWFQQLGLKLGVDKLAEGTVNKAFDIFGSSPDEMFKKNLDMKNNALKMEFDEWSKKYGEEKALYDAFRGTIIGSKSNSLDTLNQMINLPEHLKNNVESQKEAEKNIVNINDYVKSMSSSLLSNDTFNEKLNELINLNNQMIGYLRNIADSNITLTDRAVSSQGR